MDPEQSALPWRRRGKPRLLDVERRPRRRVRDRRKGSKASSEALSDAQRPKREQRGAPPVVQAHVHTKQRDLCAPAERYHDHRAPQHDHDAVEDRDQPAAEVPWSAYRMHVVWRARKSPSRDHAAMPYKLLLADDSITIQRVIELRIADEDVQVIAVGNGQRAIARAERDRPQIVLADIGMPQHQRRRSRGIHHGRSRSAADYPQIGGNSNGKCPSGSRNDATGQRPTGPTYLRLRCEGLPLSGNRRGEDEDLQTTYRPNRHEIRWMQLSEITAKSFQVNCSYRSAIRVN